ncbi:metallophosphoesterase family protein [Singulisphaera rosea]
MVEFLADRKIASVRGNHDRWALKRGLGRADEYGGGTPSPSTLRYLATLPFDLLLADMDRVGVVVHGSPRSDMEFVTRKTHPPEVLQDDLASLSADLLVVGHTHQPMWYRCAQGLIVNPGSVVSMPVVKTSRSFAFVDLSEMSVRFHDVETGDPLAIEPWSDLEGPSHPV